MRKAVTGCKVGFGSRAHAASRLEYVSRLQLEDPRLAEKTGCRFNSASEKRAMLGQCCVPVALFDRGSHFM
jgi:hypothetical protein